MYYLQDAQAPISAIDLYNNICHRIISVDLEPGTKISENTMSAEYGVSRSVLRTAFARLQQINFLEVYPQRGTFVKVLDAEHITSAATIRYVVERNAAYDIVFADKSPNQKLIFDLEEMLEQLSDTLISDSIDNMKRFRTLEAQFHLRIIQEVMTPNALGLLYEIRVHLTRWTNVDMALNGMESRLIEQNRELLEAIRTRKLQNALFKIKEHFQFLVSNMDLVRSVHPNYFRP